MKRSKKTGFCALALNGVFLLALLIQGFIPAGFMPDAKDTLVICTASGLKTIDLDSNGDPHKAVPDNHCPFAPVLTHGLAPAPALPAENAFKPFFATSTGNDQLLFSFSAQLYDSQGPPASS